MTALVSQVVCFITLVLFFQLLFSTYSCVVNLLNNRYVLLRNVKTEVRKLVGAFIAQCAQALNITEEHE